MSKKFDNCDDVIAAVEDGIDYRELMEAAQGDGEVAALAQTILGGAGDDVACHQLLDDVEAGVDYCELSETATQDDAEGVLAEVILNGDPAPLDE